MNTDSKKEIISQFLENQLLLSPDALAILDERKEFAEKRTLFAESGGDILYTNKDLLILEDGTQFAEVSWKDFEKTKFMMERKGDEKAYAHFLNYFKGNCQGGTPCPVSVLYSHEEASSKREVSDFAMYFAARLEALQKVLYCREELKNASSISRILGKNQRESTSLIGMVNDKQVTKNNNVMLTVEDMTGEIKVLINKNKPELYDLARDCVLDEVIGVAGVNGDRIVFANNIYLPDIPLSHELKKTEEEAYALFLADLHVGSNNFLSKDFERFINWINQKGGNEKQKEIASKVKYIFIIGDLVDGVGIYPGQEDELHINDVYAQYKECSRLLASIPHNITLIICPGNHDALRIAEPQPPLANEFCKELSTLPNAVLVSNPSVVNIHSSKNFAGYNVLLYHGYSFDYFVANVDSIRNNGGYDRADLIMKFLLKRRHLAPTHASTLYVPSTDYDPLVVSVIPDFFVTGHIHKSAVSSYKNVTLISCSCWQSKTPFQEKVGHHPEPSRVPVVNLATREVKILRFG